MAFPVNHKTVFVLDQSPNFSMTADTIELDVHKVRAPEYAMPTQIAKTMWTCATESVLEYCRIVWDIFPRDKLIQFVVSHMEAWSVNNWDKNEQNCASVSRGLARRGRPENSDDLQHHTQRKNRAANQK